ncbi:MAG: hypothetical protein Aurels2KO_30870 [Aureliella sp.]
MNIHAGFVLLAVQLFLSFQLARTYAQGSTADMNVDDVQSERTIGHSSLHWRVASGERPQWVSDGEAYQQRLQTAAELLDRPFNAVIKATTLKQLVELLNETAKANSHADSDRPSSLTIGIDVVELAKWGLDANVLLAVELRGKTTVRQILQTALRPLDLTWRVTETGLLITTSDNADSRRLTRVYDTAYVQKGLALPTLRNVICMALHPNVWVVSGGTSEISHLGSALIVSAPEPTHHELEQLLYSISLLSPENFSLQPSPPFDASLATGASGGAATTPTLSPASEYNQPSVYQYVSDETPKWFTRGESASRRRAQVASKLNETLNTTHDEMPLASLVERLSIATGCRMFVAADKLADSGIDLASPVTPPTVSDLTLRQLLQSVLDPLKCTWVVTEAGIEITTCDDASDRLDVRCYDLAFVQTKKIDFAQLSDAITRTCWPDDWISAGGHSVILRIGSGVIVAAPDYVHHDVRRLLAQIKSIHAGNFDLPTECFSGATSSR